MGHTPINVFKSIFLRLLPLKYTIEWNIQSNRKKKESHTEFSRCIEKTKLHTVFICYVIPAMLFESRITIKQLHKKRIFLLNLLVVCNKRWENFNRKKSWKMTGNSFIENSHPKILIGKHREFHIIQLLLQVG